MDNDMRRWTPAYLAGAVLVAALGLSAMGNGTTSVAGPGPESLASVVESAAKTVAPTEPAPPTTIRKKTKLSRTLKNGMVGDDVKMVQRRLKELRFDPGEIDGIYGGQTTRAVWAFQKLVMGVKRDKISARLTADMWTKMQDNLVFKPRRPNLSPTHAEAYLDKQVLVLFKANKPLLITHISSGSEEKWCEVAVIDPGEQGNRDGTVPLEKGICGYSWTTPGIFTFDRKYTKGDGWRKGSLGRMYRPTYFNKGLAVHGSGNVPDFPASHGCIRIPMHTADFFQQQVAVGDKIVVFDGKKEPEEYGSPEPYWDRPDPSWVPKTTVPGSSVPVSSVPPSSVRPGTPTTKPKPKPTTTTKPRTTTKPKPKPTTTTRPKPKPTTTTKPKSPTTTEWATTLPP